VTQALGEERKHYLKCFFATSRKLQKFIVFRNIIFEVCRPSCTDSCHCLCFVTETVPWSQPWSFPIYMV